MNLKHVISDIVANLARWEKTGLNEAQTRQVLVLRLFQALGYDIWNPFAVIAEQNSGGGAGSYIPDFTLRVANKNAFIVEVKALGKDFSNNDRTQAVNYVNSMGLRWALLTNGKQWLLFDNKQEGVATDRLALTIDLTTPYAADHLAELLSPKVWESDHANQTVWQAIQFLKLESKLRQIMQKGFARDRDGLELAMEVRLSADERQLAESHFEALCQRILSVEPILPAPLPVVSSTSVLPARETKETSFPLPITAPAVVGSQAEILQVLREQIELVSQTTSTHGFDITARLNGVEIKVKGWRDIVTGIAEAFIRLGREGEIQDYICDFPRERQRGKQQGKTDSGRYRQLSNSKYLHLDFTVEDHKEHANNWLSKLQVPPKVLAVTYKDETYYLPLPTSTIAVLPAREIKETSLSLPISSSRLTAVKSQAEILQLLREQIELAMESFLSRESGLTAVKLDGVEIKANNWRDILTGTAETFISLGRMEEIQHHIFFRDDSPEKTVVRGRYRQLSNGKYLRVYWNSEGLRRHINNWLNQLQVPPKVLAVTYKDETYYLPL